MVGLFRAANGEAVALFDAGQSREVWVGILGEPMAVHAVVRQRTFRDGGSVEYVTAEGGLFVPEERRADREATWRESTVLPVEPSAYTVDVAARTVSVVR